MIKKQIKAFDRTRLLLFVTTVVSTLLALGMFITVAILGTQFGSPVTDKKINVTTGIMKYDFADGKAVINNDPKIGSLEVYLTSLAKKDVEKGTCVSAPNYTVAVSTKDRTQALVKYGCGAPYASLFVSFQNDKWQAYPPTAGKVDNFSIPACDFIDKNSISKEIAPVCRQSKDGIGIEVPVYLAR